MKALTAKQKDCLDYIRAVYTETGHGPSVRELASALGVTVCTAFQHTRALSRKGFVESDRYTPRSLKPTDALAPLEQIAALTLERDHLRAALQQCADALAPFAREAEIINDWQAGEPVPDEGEEPSFIHFNAARIALDAIRAQIGDDDE